MRDHLDQISLMAWVTTQGREELLQELARLRHEEQPDGRIHPQPAEEAGGEQAGNSEHGGERVDLFADRWRVELADPRMGRRIELAYDVKVLPEPVA